VALPFLFGECAGGKEGERGGSGKKGVIPIRSVFCVHVRFPC